MKYLEGLMGKMISTIIGFNCMRASLLVAEN